MSPVSPRSSRRVAVISQGLGGIEPPRAHGSISTWTYETARHLTAQWSVLLVEFGKQAFGVRLLEHEGANYVYVPIAFNRVINGVHKRLIRLARALGRSAGSESVLRPDYASILHNFGYIVQAAWRVRRWRSDIVHIHNFSQFVPVVRAFNPRARIVLHMNCEWLSQHDPEMIAGRLLKADAIACCSDHVRRKLLEALPQFRDKAYVLYNGTNVERFAPKETTSQPEQCLRVLFVGRISPEKGVHVLIDAFTRVAAAVPNVSLELVGGAGSLPPEFLMGLSRDPHVRRLETFYHSDYLSEVKSRIPEKLRNRVSFHGSVDHEELALHYRRATVFVCPSFSDAFPLTVVEAMAAGLPVVASAVGGIPEAVVDEETGLLVEPDNPEALARALEKILADGEVQLRMAVAARSRALKHFSWHAISEQVSRIYTSERAGRANVNTA